MQQWARLHVVKQRGWRIFRIERGCKRIGGRYRFERRFRMRGAWRNHGRVDRVEQRIVGIERRGRNRRIARRKHGRWFERWRIRR
jgi:hypothetical protein